MPIIESILDTDFYKLTMAQAVRNQWPDVHVRYRFRNRTPEINLLPYREEIEKEIAALADLRLTSPEHEFLCHYPFFKRSFLDVLCRFRLDPENHVRVRERDGQLDIEVVGNWFDTIWFEVPILSIVNEVYYRRRPDVREEGRQRLQAKIAKLQELPAPCNADACDFRFMEFGTRRRYSRIWQDEVVRELARDVPRHMQGTSNVDMARRYNLRPQGTMAHEWLQAHQALAPIPLFQRAAMDNWLNEFRGSLGIVLSDVVGFDAFLRDFDALLARSFDGVRHDSGDPFEWAEKLITHYQLLGLDSRDYIAVFSDGLDFDLCFQLYERFCNDIKMVFGVGTNLTNDMGLQQLQIVMKMVECNGFPVAKLSDSPGKGMCEMPEFEGFLRRLFVTP